MNWFKRIYIRLSFNAKARWSSAAAARFIGNLEFDYIETYSLLRTPGYQDEKTEGFEELQVLKKRKEAKNNLTEQELTRMEYLFKYFGQTQYLINKEGKFHPTAEKTGSYEKDSPEVQSLIRALNMRFEDLTGFMCAPVYRDAVVFYDSNDNIVSVLNVCLSCEWLATAPSKEIIADQKTYKLLREFFIVIGHNIEDEEV